MDDRVYPAPRVQHISPIPRLWGKSTPLFYEIKNHTAMISGNPASRPSFSPWLFGLGLGLMLLLGACEYFDLPSPRCALEPETGPCDAAFPRYYYDKAEGTCKQFTWGGCEGTVPFETLEACQEACGCDD